MEAQPRIRPCKHAFMGMSGPRSACNQNQWSAAPSRCDNQPPPLPPPPISPLPPRRHLCGERGVRRQHLHGVAACQPEGQRPACGGGGGCVSARGGGGTARRYGRRQGWDEGSGGRRGGLRCESVDADPKPAHARICITRCLTHCAILCPRQTPTLETI